MPGTLDHKQLFSKLSLSLIAIVSLILIACSSPPFIQYAITELFTDAQKETLLINKNEIKSWLSFVSIVLEIFIAIFIGGSVFGVKLTNKFKDALSEYQDTVSETLDYDRISLDSIATRRFLQIKSILSNISLKTFFKDLSALSRHSKNLKSAILSDIPRFQRKYILVMLTANFPGGFFGFLAFICFIILTILKILQIYLESQWLEISRWMG